MSPQKRKGRSTARQGVLVAIAALTALGAMNSPTPSSALAAGATLAGLILLLWRDNEPPVLLLPVIYQWSVVAVKPILSIVNGRPLNMLADFGADIEQAAYFGFGAIIALAIGLRLGSSARSQNNQALLLSEARAWKPRKIIVASLVAIALGHAFTAASAFAGPARQAFLAMGGLTTIGLFAIAYWCLATRQAYAVLTGVMGFEILVGMTGFFAGFKEPILVFGLAAISARPSVKATDMAVVGLAGALLLGVAVFWTSVKGDYRDFVNEGTGAQVVSVSMSQRLEHLGAAAGSFDKAAFEIGFEKLLRRHSYIDFLANTMWHVPAKVPHENGKQLGESLLHIVTPRILFPNKPPTPFDSDVTAYYTGLQTNKNPDTSISIGYLGELYIDFAVGGALVACLALGYIAGFGYRALASPGRGSILFTYGLAVTFALRLATFETALIKLLGGTVTAYIAALLIKRYVLPTLLSGLAPKRAKRQVMADPALEPMA